MGDKRLTLKTVNRALAALGYDERLQKAKDYFYFAEGESSNWPETMVLVCRLNDLTLTDWLHEHALLRGAARRHHEAAGYEALWEQDAQRGGPCGSY